MGLTAAQAKQRLAEAARRRADCAEMLLRAFEEEGVSLLDELKVGRTVKVRKISLYKKTLGLEDLPEESWVGRVADVVVPDDPLKEPVQVVVEFADGRTRQLHASVFDLGMEPEVPKVPEPTIRDLARAAASGVYRTVEELPPPLQRAAKKLLPDLEKLDWPDVTRGLLAYARKSAMDLDQELSDPKTRMKLFGQLLEDTGSGPLGSNPGSWHVDRSTGDRWYVKFYRDPDQARCEYVANRLYRELGIPVPELRLALKGDRLATASHELKRIRNVPPDVLMNHRDVQKGFAADAWLANWDVVGLNYDNIVVSADRAYRMDQGGSLLFRARGAPKGSLFRAKEVPELNTLKDPSINPQAAAVFRNVPKEAVVRGIKDILAVPEARIRQFAVESGLDDDTAERLVNTLLGRREYLRRMLDVLEPSPSSEEEIQLRRPGKIAQTLLKLDKIPKKTLNTVRGIGLRLDTDLVENLYARVRVITEPTGERKYVMTLKVTDAAAGELEGRLREAGVSRVSIEWTELKAGKGVVKRNPAITRYVGNGIELRDRGLRVVLADKQGNYALTGYVRVEVEAEDTQSFLATLEKFLSRMNMERLIWEVEPEYDKIYRLRRAAWQQRKEDLVAPYVSYGHAKAAAADNPELAALLERAERLELKEVIPGYFTHVDPLQAEELMNEGALGVYHKITASNPEQSVVNIIKNGGLLASLERWDSGILSTGMSTYDDFRTGGADSVFVRLVTSRVTGNLDRFIANRGQVNIVFKPRVLNRTDWYAYTGDKYGTTAPRTFNNRPTPVRFVRELVEQWDERNEIMFRKGISVEDIDHIVVRSAQVRDRILQLLRRAKITEVARRPIEDIIKVAD